MHFISGRRGQFLARKSSFFYATVDETWLEYPGHQKNDMGAKGAGPDRNHGETAVFAFGQKVKNGPKIRFLL